MLLIHRVEMTEGFADSAKCSYHGDNTSATPWINCHRHGWLQLLIVAAKKPNGKIEGGVIGNREKH